MATANDSSTVRGGNDIQSVCKAEARCIIHNIADDDVDAEATIKSYLEHHVIVHQCHPAYAGKRVKYLSSSLEITVRPKDPSTRTSDELTRCVEQIWNDIVHDGEMREFWLETSISRATSTLSAGAHHLAVRMVSLGALTSPATFKCHWKSEYRKASMVRAYDDLDLLFYDDYYGIDEDNEVERNTIDSTYAVEFQYDNELIVVSWTEANPDRWHMEISFDSLADRVVLLNTDGSADRLYFFLGNQPKLYRGVAHQRRISWMFDDDEDVKLVWERDVRFGTCDRNVIGSSNAVQIQIDPLSTDKIDGLLQRLSRHGFSIYRGNPQTVEAVRNKDIQWPQFDTFEAKYAWYSLITRGFKVTDQISSEVIEFLQAEPENESLIARLLHTVGENFDNHCVVSLNETTLRRVWETLLQYRDVDDEDDERQLEHLVKVRRLILTPTTLRALPAEHIVGNRVVREFGVDRFVRVVIRDEDMQLLNSSAYPVKKPVQAIVDFLREDLAIGDDRRYHYLGCSNSQMRLHGLWMYAGDGQHTVSGIRRWMGDLSHERCIATYVSRLGQFFSASKKAVNVDEKCKQLILDVTRHGHCFTDGVGKISTSLAEKVTKSLNFRCSPSAFQIRYGGCKGVVSVHPDLEDDQLHVRDSMEKFKSDHHELEVVQHTKPGRLHLNRQVIVLMSGLGVPNQAFFALQDNMLQQLADMLVRKKSAVDALSQIRFGLPRQELLRSGVCVTKEPFLSSVLRNIYEHKLNSLMKKTRIEMSTEDGRIMMGTADETGLLQYGQVFVQYSVNIDRPQEETKVLEGLVVIAKNPCFHPGDMRKFTAVNVSQLRHMVDCVVFPTQGSRPHPDEMSGSDLDGDMYFVCWYSPLVPPGENREPMNYKPKRKEFLLNPVTEADMIEFIGSFIEGDKLGVIANSHLAHADMQEDGIFSDQCFELSQMHSDAVDFPKTGYHVQMPRDLRPQQYPHYMLKRDKPTHKSHHILGQLFDQCQLIMSNRVVQTVDLEAAFDKQFLAPGYEKYLDRAATIHDYYRRNISRLMGEYGISTEAEITTGHIIKLKAQRRGTLQKEHVEIAEIINSRLKAIKAKVKEMFYHAGDGDQSSENNDELCRLASAVYYITYSESARERRCLSLPWVFVDHLLSARKLKANHQTKLKLTAQESTAERQSWSVLHQLSKEVAEFKETDRRQQEVRIQRTKAFQRLASVLALISDVQVVLSVFGSHATGLDNWSSSLDVFVGVKSPKRLSQKIFEQIMQVVRRDYNIPRKQSWKLQMKPVIVIDEVNRVKICLYTSEICLNRTAYIISAIAQNFWIFPILLTMMSWAKQSKIIGSDRGSTMTGEQLIMLFLSYVYKNDPDIFQVSQEDKDRVVQLIAQNHFQSCSAATCSHIKEPNEDFQTSDDAMLTSHSQHGEDKHADVILNFLSHSSRLQGEILKDVIDPVCEDGRTKLLNMKESQYPRLAERMLKAYHTLAQNGHFVHLASSNTLSDGHLLVDLPRQVCSRILLTEKAYAEKLKRESKAEVVEIRRRPYKDALAGLVLEAWGNFQSLQLIQDMISDEAKVKPSLLSAGASHFAMEDAYITLFKKCSPQPSMVTLQPYSGPCQSNHDPFERHIPRLLCPDPNSSHCYEKFVEYSLKQFHLMSANYDKLLHGRLRAVISYGTLYVANCHVRPILDTEFDSLFASRANSAPADFASPWGKKRRRGRGRGGYRGRDQPPNDNNCRSSFIPTGNPDLSNTRLQTFLKNNDFVLAEEAVEYRLSLKLSISGQRLKLEGVVVLDENFHFKSLEMPDLKWLCVNIVSSDKDLAYRPYDCRIKIQSRVIRNLAQARREVDDFADVVAKHRTILLRSGGEVCGVHGDFLTRVGFVRKKQKYIYRLAANEHASATDPFLYGMSIRINYGTEFSRPSQTGLFQKIDRDRAEVTVVPDLPDLGDEEKIMTFLNSSWQFAEELGSILE